METCPTRFRLLFIHTMQKKQQIRNSTAEFLIFAMQGDAEGIEVRLEDDTVWLTQQMLASLYGSSRTNVLEHIQHIYADEELEESATCRKIRQVQKEGNRNVNRETLFYNLDIIIAVGYRVNSKRATQFRQWATAVLRDFAIRGYVLDRKRMENGKFLGQDYFEHLLAEIREIRLSERRFYQKITDIYATSMDYDAHAPETRAFYAKVQNKLHYAVHGHTAAELIFQRADSEKPFMGLTSFAGDFPSFKDIGIAKNYLNEKELMILKNLVSGYFDLAEINAMEHKPMYMKDYINLLDRLLTTGDRQILYDAGSISNEKALEKAMSEYRKYQNNTLSPVEEAYLKIIKETLHTIDDRK